MQEGHRRRGARLVLLLPFVVLLGDACGPDRAGAPDGADSPSTTAGSAAPGGTRPSDAANGSRIDGPPSPPPGTALAGYDFTADAGGGVALPRGLGEVSGLAVDDRGRLYAHGDERAVVFVLTPAGGGTTGDGGDAGAPDSPAGDGGAAESPAGDGGAAESSGGEAPRYSAHRFGAGRPVLRADLEGIALAGGRIWMVDSDGTLLSMPPGGAEEIVPHRVVRTALGTVCEVEGLAHDPVWDKLLLACKDARAAEARDRLRLYHFSTASEALDGHPVIDVPLEELETMGLRDRLNPSGVELHPVTDSYLVLAAREGLLVEVSRAGHPVAAVRLPTDRLPQAEGIAVAPDGTLWIATEGGGRAGRLFRWAWRPAR